MKAATRWIAVLAALTAFSATLVRLPIGVDFSDEAYYAVIGYRQSLGDRPFLDDINLTQTMGLITSPLIASYRFATGGMDGVVLFLRQLWVTLNLVVAGAVFAALRRRIEWPAALLTSLLCVVFIPYSLPTLSYNTLGSGLFALGVFLALHGIFGRAGPGLFLACGLVHGLAMLAYPNLIVAAGACALCWLPLLRERRATLLGAYAIGGVAVGVYALARVTPEGFAYAYEFMASRRSVEVGRLTELLVGLWSQLPLGGLAIPMLALLLWLGKRHPTWILCSLPLLPLLCARNPEDPPTPQWTSLWLVSSWGLMAPLLLPFAWRTPWARQLFLGACVPSLVAGLVFAWSSGNAVRAAALGLVPAALAASALVYEGLRRAAERMRHPAFGLAPVVAPLLLIALLLNLVGEVYDAPDVRAERKRITWGPFEGLTALPQKEVFLRGIWLAIEPLVDPDGQIVFYDHFPAGYLLTPAKPASPSLFACYKRIRRQVPEFCANHFAEFADEKTVAVHIPWPRISGDHKPESRRREDRAMDSFVRRHYSLAVEHRDGAPRPAFQVYAGPATSPRGPRRP